jgi:hypothetical protein
MQDANQALQLKGGLDHASRRSHFAFPMAAPVGNLSCEGRKQSNRGLREQHFSRRIERESRVANAYRTK